MSICILRKSIHLLKFTLKCTLLTIVCIIDSFYICTVNTYMIILVSVSARLAVCVTLAIGLSCIFEMLHYLVMVCYMMAEITIKYKWSRNR